MVYESVPHLVLVVYESVPHEVLVLHEPVPRSVLVMREFAPERAPVVHESELGLVRAAIRALSVVLPPRLAGLLVWSGGGAGSGPVATGVAASFVAVVLCSGNLGKRGDGVSEAVVAGAGWSGIATRFSGVVVVCSVTSMTSCLSSSSDTMARLFFAH